MHDDETAVNIKLFIHDDAKHLPGRLDTIFPFFLRQKLEELFGRALVKRQDASRELLVTLVVIFL